MTTDPAPALSTFLLTRPDPYLEGGRHRAMIVADHAPEDARRRAAAYELKMSGEVAGSREDASAEWLAARVDCLRLGDSTAPAPMVVHAFFS